MSARGERASSLFLWLWRLNPKRPHLMVREPGVELPVRSLEKWAATAREQGALRLADELENVAGGHSIPGWGFTCVVCGSTDPHDRWPCPGIRL